MSNPEQRGTCKEIPRYTSHTEMIPHVKRMDCSQWTPVRQERAAQPERIATCAECGAEVPVNENFPSALYICTPCREKKASQPAGEVAVAQLDATNKLGISRPTATSGTNVQPDLDADETWRGIGEVERPARDWADIWAQDFHDTYERAAPQFGYETRKESAKPWSEVPENNRKLMTAVVAEVLCRFMKSRARVEAGAQPESRKYLHYNAETSTDQPLYYQYDPLKDTFFMADPQPLAGRARSGSSPEVKK